VTVSEAAKKIGISASRLYQLVSARQIVHYRIGGKIIFHEDDVAAFLAGCRIGTAPVQAAVAVPRLRLKHITLNRGS
jgi:excisionase family DNA binding protein